MELSGLEPSAFIALANTMGHSVLVETMKMAAYYVQHSNGVFKGQAFIHRHMKEAKSCFLFVQGTGLEVIINRFGMSYDSEALKHGFNYYLRHS